MPKIYSDKNVYEAAMERYETIFRHFDHIYFSVSGGKDSSIMLQLAAQAARRLGKKLSVLYIDLEAQYQATITHVEELIQCTRDVTERWYWVALPLSLRNAASAICPKWICWDKKDRDKWVRPLPDRDDVCLITEDHYPKEWTWFRRGMEFEEFILYFAKWFSVSRGGPAAAGIGIRSDESLNRFRTIISNTKERYLDYPWTTRIKIHDKPTDCWNFYPIYDWSAADDWTAVAKFDLKFNYIYELMYKTASPSVNSASASPMETTSAKALISSAIWNPKPGKRSCTAWKESISAIFTAGPASSAISDLKNRIPCPGNNMRFFFWKAWACTRRRYGIIIIQK